MTALLAESMFAKNPRATILYDVRASWAVKDVAEKAGGRALMNRVGHAFFKTRMRDEHAVFGGEVSGHYYFHDFYCADSGTIPALLILELLSTRGARMSELLEPYRSKYFISGEINSEVSDQEGSSRNSLPSTRTATSTTWTASRWNTTTGTSTSARRTPSRSCACAWSHCAHVKTWSVAVTRYSQ